ncbi:MAG: four helix bundle protein [Bacteroidota bacterium]
MSYQYSFEKLDVWKKLRELVSKIYKITKHFPAEERYSLTDQIRRSAISVPSNLAEGSSRITNKDKAHFTNLSFSSLMEVLSHVFIAHDLKYITDEDLNSIKESIAEISNKLNSLRKSQLNSSTN